ncbi:hypothetical protein SAMN05421504_1021121 [Amycolatopsis xylanica]|uniref:Uncharacterized protein n=1 Tax=Amycolatopsis xylanica TaxID=589385 RepID=A0A1H3AZA3_9PSEU|nr:hypothetical protein [Amycolatopsis xylanica]SDX35017.1 hypothetical protein SAMN05421504_1021121 [Amycolatopsis xylanica]
MRMVFIGAGPEDFDRAQRRLLDEFQAWAEIRGRAVDPAAAGAVLEYRYLTDGLLGRWTGALLREVLSHEFTDVDMTPATVGALFDFFADTDLFDDRSDSVEFLREALADIAAGFDEQERHARLPQFSTPIFDLAEDDELREQAEGTAIVRRMHEFLEWLDEDRTLPDDIDDFPEGRKLFALAEGIGMFRDEPPDDLLTDALALWTKMFDRMDIWVGADSPSDFIGGDGKTLLGILAAILGGQGHAPEELVFRSQATVANDPDGRDEFDRLRTLLFDYGLAAREVRTMRHLLPEVHDEDEVTLPLYRLLPLGVRALHGVYSHGGVHTTTFQDLTRETPEVMIAKMLASDPALADALMESWIAMHPPGDARAELIELIGRTDDFEHRMFALDLLGKLGQIGVEAIVALRDNPICGPCVATWLTRHGMLPEEDISERELVYVRLDVLTSGLRQAPGRTMAQFAAQPRHLQVLMVEDMPGSGHPCTGEVLTKIATDHPDDFVAKAARQALDRLRAE